MGKCYGWRDDNIECQCYLGIDDFAQRQKIIIRCKWLYKIKHNVDRYLSRYNTTFVTKSYALTYDISYE
jgi:hypothetical protein